MGEQARGNGRVRRRRRWTILGILGILMGALAAGSTTVAAQTTATTTLDGTVTYQDGPSPGLVVDLFEMAGDGSRGGWLGDTTTDGQGRFRFDVEERCFVVVAIAPEGRRFQNGTRWSQEPVCVDGPTTLDPAQIVGDRPVVDRPQGTIRWSGGQPAEGVVVDLFEGSRRANRYVTSTTTDPDGRYAFDVTDPGSCYAITAIAPDGSRFTTGSSWHNGGNCIGFEDALLEGDGPGPDPVSCPFPRTANWFRIFNTIPVPDQVMADGRVNVYRNGLSLFDPATGAVQDSGLVMGFIGEYGGEAYYLYDFRIHTYDWTAGRLGPEVPLVPGGEPFVHRPVLTDDGILVYEGYGSADDQTFGVVTHALATGETTFVAPFDEAAFIRGYDPEQRRVHLSRLDSLDPNTGTIVESSASGIAGTAFVTEYRDGRIESVVIPEANALTRWSYDYTTDRAERVDARLAASSYTLFRPNGGRASVIDWAGGRVYFHGIRTDGVGGPGISEPTLWSLPLPTSDGQTVEATPLGEFDTVTDLRVDDDGNLHVLADGGFVVHDPATGELTRYPGCGTPYGLGEADGTVYLSTNLADGQAATFVVGG